MPRRSALDCSATQPPRINGSSVRSVTSAEERYLEFMKTYAAIALRVPQWMIASYLGLTPETLSRIRKNLSRK